MFGLRLTRDTKYKILLFVAICLLYYFGTVTHLFERDYNEEFQYPLDTNVTDCIIHLRRNTKKCDIVNSYDFEFIHKCSGKCEIENDLGEIRLVMLVKSAVEDAHRRAAIRNSWGFERRFSDVTVKTVFVVGKSSAFPNVNIAEEQDKYGDIVQVDFLDSYYNNSIKTMMSIKWATIFCNNARFYLFSDDDMYISVKNVLRFVRNPTQYPDYLKPTIYNRSGKITVEERIVFDFDLPKMAKLYAGNVIVSTPQRHMCSKWYVPLSEYPYHLFPPYINAGAFILSREALLWIYDGSLFTKRFRFDDVYIGIIAKKVNILPFHCPEFYFTKKNPDKFNNYKYTIASHGFGDPRELLHVWNEQKSLGNA